MLAWDHSSPVAGFAITVDGVRNDLGLSPIGPDGTCGCSVPAWFIGTRHQVMVSAYNLFGETRGPLLIVGPTADTGGPYSGVVGTNLTVSGSASVDSTSDITRYDWSWGDGTGSTSANAGASHSYDNAGTYSITVTVTDSDGASDTMTTTATIGTTTKARHR